MRRKFSLYLLAGLMAWVGLGINPVLAEDDALKTSAAVSNILFEYDASEYTSFTIQDNGFLDVTFARNTPDALFSEILNKLQNHPDIKGVLAGKNGPSCSLF